MIFQRRSGSTLRTSATISAKPIPAGISIDLDASSWWFSRITVLPLEAGFCAIIMEISIGNEVN